MTALPPVDGTTPQSAHRPTRASPDPTPPSDDEDLTDGVLFHFARYVPLPSDALLRVDTMVADVL